MRFLHLSDLHIGKRLNEFSLLEDQAYILGQILEITKSEQPDGVLIAGDVYDKAAPSAEAVGLFDDFLTRLSRSGTAVFLISGNHDSPERVAYGSRILDRCRIYLSPLYEGKTEPVILKDEIGEVAVYLLPFLKPAMLRRFWPEEEIGSYTDALRLAVGAMDISPSRRNILVAHQFVTGASRCESEEVTIGGLDNVDASVFAAFDYVALGHLHSPQKVGRDTLRYCGTPLKYSFSEASQHKSVTFVELGHIHSPQSIGETIRYCGTPLKYSFSEAGQEKSVTVVELSEKGSLQLRTIPLKPLHDLRELRGRYGELTARSFYEGTPTEDYLHIVLTDEEDVLGAAEKLRTIYPNLMKLSYDNRRTRSDRVLESASGVEEKSPLELLSELYRLQNNQEMSEEQQTYAASVFEAVKEGEE